MRRALAAVLLLLCSRTAGATDLAVTDVAIARVPNTPTAHVTSNVAWQNAWRNERNHDAAWIFVKVRAAGGPWRHASIIRASLQPVARLLQPPSIAVSPDLVGLFVSAASPMRGPVIWSLDLTVDLSLIRDLSADSALETRVFGVEMVQIPEGAFTLGDPDPAALKFAAFYRSNAAGSPDGLIEIRSEEAIEVGAAMGALNYQVEHPEYQGDRQGPIPAAFPKGFRAFYAMKYRALAGPVCRVPQYARGRGDGVPRHPRRPGILPASWNHSSRGRSLLGGAGNTACKSCQLGRCDRLCGLGRPAADDGARVRESRTRYVASDWARVSMGNVNRRPHAPRDAAERRPRLEQQRR